MSRKAINYDEFPNVPGDPVPAGDPNEPGDQDKDNENLDQQTKQIIESGSVSISKGRHIVNCLTIIGQIEGHFILPPQNKTTKYEHIIPQIVAIEEDPAIEGLLIILNTVGGDVEAGLAIAELISGMKKPTVSLVLGGGHSIGVPLAVAARKSFITPTATMTVHPVRMNGLIVGVPQSLGYFYKMQDRITKFVTDNSNISVKRFKELMTNTGELVMDVGTILDGKSAVKEGIIDKLGGLSDAVDSLYAMIEEKEAASKGRARKKESTKESSTAKAPENEKKRRGRRPKSEAETSGKKYSPAGIRLNEAGKFGSLENRYGSEKRDAGRGKHKL